MVSLFRRDRPCRGQNPALRRGPVQLAIAIEPVPETQAGGAGFEPVPHGRPHPSGRPFRGAAHAGHGDRQAGHKPQFQADRRHARRRRGRCGGLRRLLAAASPAPVRSPHPQKLIMGRHPHAGPDLVPVHARHLDDVLDRAASRRRGNAQVHGLGAGAPDLQPVSRALVDRCADGLQTAHHSWPHAFRHHPLHPPRPRLQRADLVHLPSRFPDRADPRQTSAKDYSQTRGHAGGAPSYGGPTVLRQMAESGQEGS